MVQQTVNEDGSYTLTLTPSVSTVGSTVTVTVFPRSGGAGSVVGTASGAAANADIAITLDFSGIAPGFYAVEAVAGIAAANPTVLLPTNAARPYMIYIADLQSY